ncbi:MAG: GTPase ObgE [Pirellulaceae bacterium]
MFVDRVEIEVTGGRGGNGCMSFRRERDSPHGGPDGGEGGKGGDIVIVAREGVDSLMALSHRKHWRAGRGNHGSGKKQQGRNGQDLVIEVPPGTVVCDAVDGFVIKDLTESEQQFVVARGGRGGHGNTHFKSSTNQAPRQWTPGGDGEYRRVVLELKVIADVGLVGLPNAGKSTLLSRLSRARPQIADYPFTTRYPNLGLVQIDLSRSFVMADIPGLIDGAHRGVGLGHDFLKHIERSGIIVHLVEPMPLDESDPVENYQSIRNELVQYNPQLGERPEIVAVTKSELPGADEIRNRLVEVIGDEVLLISAVTGDGLPQLTARIVAQLDEQALCK